jgi:hypothetical protein
MNIERVLYGIPKGSTERYEEVILLTNATDTLIERGRFQIYRKNRPYENILSSSDKLRKRGFATKERAENWARINAAEDFQVFESAKCGSYFTDMVHNVCSEARLALAKIQTVHVRTERLLA